MSSDNPDARKPRMKLWKIVLIVIFSLWALGTIAEMINPSSSVTTTISSPKEPIETYDDSWIPTGFTGYATDDNLAWRWGTKSETNCTYSSGACWSVMVVTKDGCPSGLYGEIAILDKSEVQIDYTNDTTTLVPAGTKVKMTFDTFNEEADTARLSQLTCR
jgi:hypothetical protein